MFATNHSPEEAQRLAQQSIQEIQGSVMFVRLHCDASYLETIAQQILERL